MRGSETVRFADRTGWRLPTIIEFISLSEIHDTDVESETKEYYVSALDLLFGRRSKHLTKSLNQDFISASARTRERRRLPLLQLGPGIHWIWRFKGPGLSHGVVDLLFDSKEGTGCVLLVCET